MSIDKYIKIFFLNIFIWATLLIVACDDEKSPHHLIVKIIYSPDGQGDRSFNDSAYGGLLEYKIKYNFDMVEYTPQTIEDAELKFNEWINASLSKNTEELIIILGSLYDDFINKENCDFGLRKVLNLDSFPNECPNLVSIRYEVFTPSFLAGVASMVVSKNKKAAIIAGMEMEAVEEFIKGYKAGVIYAGGEVTETVYLSKTADGFNMPDEAKVKAKQMFEDVDVIFPVAGGSSLGVVDAAKELDKDRSLNDEETEKFTIGVDSDQSIRGTEVVIGSVLKRLDNSVKNVIKNLLNKEFVSGNYVYGFEENYTEFYINPNFSEKLQNAVDAAVSDALSASMQIH